MQGAARAAQLTLRLTSLFWRPREQSWTLQLGLVSWERSLRKHATNILSYPFPKTSNKITWEQQSCSEMALGNK